MGNAGKVAKVNGRSRYSSDKEVSEIINKCFSFVKGFLARAKSEFEFVSKESNMNKGFRFRFRYL